MADSFDPYHKWLGISPKDQPPNHYRLLAIELYESDPDVIEGAADRQMAHVRTFQAGQNSALSQRILNELSAARLCLLDPQKKAEYDRQLRAKTESQKAAASPVLPLPLGEGRGEGVVLPLPPGEGRGEGALPRPAAQIKALPLARPLPQARPASAEPAPVIISSPAGSTSSIHQRPFRKTPIWRQPAVLGTLGAVAIFAGIAYALTRSSKPSVDVVATKPTADRPDAAPPSAANPDNPPLPAAEKSPFVLAVTPTTVQPPTAQSVPSQADFDILAATWGADDKWVDVTDGVRSVVKDNRLMMIVWSDLFGKPEDPAPGVGKKLRIRYRSRGKEYAADYFDSWFVYLDGNPLAPPTDSPDALELLEARYGAGGTFVDVLPQLAPRVAAGRLSVAADEFAATTAAELEKHGIGPPTFKVLWVRYRDHTGEHFDFAWNSQLLTIDTRLPPAAGRPVDLLKLIELPRHVVYGDWSMKDGKLLAPAQMAARVQIPYRVPSDYALKVVVESDGQLAEVSTGLVVGGHQVIIPLDSGGDSSFSGMALLRGLWHGDYQNPTKTWRLAHMLEQGRPNTLTYIVRPTSVRVLRDGAEIVRWSGDPAIFSVPDNWKVIDPQKLYLQSYNFPYRITKVELTPLAPDTTPMLTLGESGPPVDVQKSIDPERDRLHGDWQYDGQALVSPADDIGARLRLPAIVPDSYQLDLVAQRESGTGLFLTVPVAGAEGTLCLDSYEGKISGLQKIDDQLIDKNETRYDGAIFADGKRHLVRLTVRKNHVRLVCDGKPIVDWTGDVSRLKSTESFPYHDRIYVGTWQSRYRLTQIKLRALRGDEPDETPPVLAGEPVDLLKQIDVKRDAVNGKWELSDSILVSPDEGFAKLQLPPPPPAEEYRLAMVVERSEGPYGISAVLLVGGRQVMATLDGWDGSFAGLEAVDGKSCNDNLTTRHGRLLTDRKPCQLVFTVRRNSVDVTMDGKPVIQWKGDPAHLSMIPDWALRDKTRLGLTSHLTVCRISKIEIAPLVPEAVSPAPPAPAAVAGPPPITPPDRKFSDLASGKDNGSAKETRLPVPDDEAQKDARKEMQKKFAGAIKAAKTFEQKRALAQELAQKAVVGDDQGAYAYVLLKQAIDLAEAAGEVELAWQTIDQLAKTFAVEGMALRNQSLSEIGKSAKSPAQAWQLTDAACRLITAAFTAGDAATVKKAASQAQSFAKRTKEAALQKEVNNRASDAGKLAAEIEAVDAARETLKTSPDDPQANLTVGHYELCAAGDFDSALPKLAKASDETWKKLAADELALANRQPTGPRTFVNGRLMTRSEPADAQRELAVADAWWSRADDEPWPGKHYLRMRAAKWYGSAYRSLVDAGRTRAAERLKILLATDDGFPHWELFNWRGFQQGQPSGDVVRLSRGGNGLETAVEYGGTIDVTLIARTTGTDIKLNSHNFGWGWNFKVLPNQWHTLRFLITPVSRTAIVDGVPLENDTSRTPRTLNAAPVYVWVSDDDIVEIKKFIVRSTE